MVPQAKDSIQQRSTERPLGASCKLQRKREREREREEERGRREEGGSCVFV